MIFQIFPKFFLGHFPKRRKRRLLLQQQTGSKGKYPGDFLLHKFSQLSLSEKEKADKEYLTFIFLKYILFRSVIVSSKQNIISRRKNAIPGFRENRI